MSDSPGQPPLAFVTASLTKEDGVYRQIETERIAEQLRRRQMDAQCEASSLSMHCQGEAF